MRPYDSTIEESELLIQIFLSVSAFLVQGVAFSRYQILMPIRPGFLKRSDREKATLTLDRVIIKSCIVIVS